MSRRARTSLRSTSDSVDVVFTSNFFEHLPDSAASLRPFASADGSCDSDGRLIVLMPNIRYLAGAYWDYLDHHLALTHHSLTEALRLSGFEPVEVIPRFLPVYGQGPAYASVSGSRAPLPARATCLADTRKADARGGASCALSTTR